MLPQEKIVKILKNKGLKLATAESCTGGLIAKLITDVPGSSAMFDMGIVSYANEIKHRFLGVPNEILDTVGAVSEETAKAMAIGVCNAANADIATATTGIAGPTGGTPEKPVGLVYVGCYCNGVVTVEECRFEGDREQNRNAAVEAALELLWKTLSNSQKS